jgi:hypothetical protein
MNTGIAFATAYNSGDAATIAAYMAAYSSLKTAPASIPAHVTSGECFGCHNGVATAGNFTSINNWLSGAPSGGHASTGSTAGSTLVCESCHGSGSTALMQNCSQSASGGGPCSLAYSDSLKVNPKNRNGNWSTPSTSGSSQVYANHFWDGHSTSTATSSYCTSCHTDFTSFGYNQPATGTVSLSYAHSASTSVTTLGGVNYSGGYCINCHYFDNSSKYTAMTNYYSGSNAYVTFPSGNDIVGTTTSPYALLSTTPVSGNVNGSLNNVMHGTASGNTSYDCSNCHQYRSHTSVGTQEWSTTHTAQIYGVSSSKQSKNGCALCH